MHDTLATLFRVAVAHDKREAILTRESGIYSPISSKELERRVVNLHLALRRAGLGRGSKCALLSENRWEWAVADFAMMTAGIVSVPIYPNLPAGQVQYLLDHSEAQAVVCSNRLQLNKVLAIRRELPHLDTVITFDPIAEENATQLDSLIGTSDPSPEAKKAFDEAIDSVQPHDLASIIYTSGTTGTPKGAMLSHGNITTNIRDSQLVIRRDDVALSFLPLSHIAERMADYVCFKMGTTIAYAESLESVSINIQEVRPTAAVGVPRFFEKIHERIEEGVESAPVWRRKLFNWAVDVGKAAVPYRLADEPLPWSLKPKHWIADKLVFDKLQRALGGRIRYFVCGAAPLGRKLAEFFHVFGLPIYEGYGLTEASPLVSISTPSNIKFGSVGQIIPNVEVRIAADGEILVRGPNVMQGYYKMESLTAEVIVDSWLYTGDVGRLDDEGFLWITDRKKDLIKTSAGKYIVPSLIENRLRSSPLIDTAIVVGERRNYPCALIVPNFEKLRAWTQSAGIECTSDEEICGQPEVQDRIMAEVIIRCAELARFEKVKKIALIERPFSIEEGDLTPTMKVKRREVIAKYAHKIDAMYA